MTRSAGGMPSSLHSYGQRGHVRYSKFCIVQNLHLCGCILHCSKYSTASSGSMGVFGSCREEFLHHGWVSVIQAGFPQVPRHACSSARCPSLSGTSLAGLSQHATSSQTHGQDARLYSKSCEGAPALHHHVLLFDQVDGPVRSLLLKNSWIVDCNLGIQVEPLQAPIHAGFSDRCLYSEALLHRS